MLSVTDLSAGYGAGGPALCDLSADIAEGEVVAVLGSNGAGKTTLLRTVSRTLVLHGGRVAAGTIEFRGSPLPRSPRGVVAAGLVQVPEGRRIFGRLTVEENLRIGGHAARDRKNRLRRRDEVYDLFPILRERAAYRGSLLSGGEQQMLAIGRALMSAPRLLMLDEPSLGLAPLAVRGIGDVLREINERGTTVLLVEQNASLAMSVATRALVIDAGRVVREGAPDEVGKNLGKQYLGSGSSSRHQA